MNDRIPTIALDFKKDCFRVHRATLILLREPPYLLFMVDPEKKAICVRTGDPDDPSAHRVASHRRKHAYYELYSKSLMMTLLSCGSWDPQTCYRLSGTMVNDHTAVFSFASSSRESGDTV